MIRIHLHRSTEARRWSWELSWKRHIVANWTLLKKSILLLILAALMNLFWIIWDIVVLINPEYAEWVHLRLVRSQLCTSLIMLAVLSVLVIPCHLFREQHWAQEILPILNVQVFTAMLCHNSYLVGSFSPATMVGYVSIVGVGLVLFDRRMVYCALIPATLALLFCNYLSMTGVLTYAPLFNMQHLNQAVMHPFWVASMLFFLVPILLACLFLFEVLLTQWRTREQTIQNLSRLDPLTNVLNRRSIGHYLDRLHQQPEQQYSIVLLDLDHFKNINDHFGHTMGDQVLIRVAQCLTAHVREHDLIGRFGGEEFIVLLPNTATAQAQQLAERCRLAISRLGFITQQRQAFTVSASFGVSSSLSADEPHLVISQADQALYAAKAAGRNQVRSFTDLIKS